MTSVHGPMPGVGPFHSLEEALVGACQTIVRQPNAVIPVRPDHQNFKLYWKLSAEYCAWLYSGKENEIEMTWLVNDPVQADPTRRTCPLPPFVEDDRYEPSTLAYLIVLHNHVYDENLSTDDLVDLVRKAQIHGTSVVLGGKLTWISAVAFLGRETDGTVECAGFYYYSFERDNEIRKLVRAENGVWIPKVVARVEWLLDGTVKIHPLEPQSSTASPK